MGGNAKGQLGNGTTIDSMIPQMIVASNVTAIAAGGFHSLFLKSDGSLWGMGYNADGELGDGLTADLHIPQPLVSSGVTAIAAGLYHSLFLKSGGSLWVMGKNDDGQLGNGTTIGSYFPVEIVTNQVTMIAAGGFYSLFVKRLGTVGRFTTDLWAMGDNAKGQLGDGTTTSRSTPEFILSYTEPTLGYPVTAIFCGEDFSLFLESNGSLWDMGDNSSGQLGDGTYTSHTRPEQILPSDVIRAAANSSDFGFSFFIKSDGSLWGMGDATAGELGNGNDIYTAGNNPISFPNPQLIVANGVTAAAAGQTNGLFVSLGNLWVMGNNSNGQLGDGVPELANEFVDHPECVVAGPPPAISIGQYSNSPVVLFPTTGATTYTVQMSTNLNSSNWLTISAVPFSGFQITNPPSNAFFRLVSP